MTPTACLLLLVALGADAAAPAAGLAVPGEVASTSNDLAHALGRKLRCPVCQGMPISESPATMAQDMMKRVNALLAEGKTPDEVLHYFTSRYGEWVLLEPPSHGFYGLVWGLPPLALVLLGIWGVMTMRRLRHGAAVAASPPPAASAADDEALRSIRQEVQR